MSLRPTRSTAWLLALVAYVPALIAAPGRMPADSKLYLYLDPGRVLARNRRVTLGFGGMNDG